MMRRIDLLPASYQERRRERRNVAAVIVAGMVVLLLMIGWWVALGAQISGQREDLAEAQARNERLRADIAELSRFADLAAEVDAKRTALQTVMAGDVDWPSIMTELAMVIPGEVWLTALQASAGATEGASPVATETAPIRVSQQTPFGRISFTGRALSMPGVARWLIRLGTVREFAAIWLSNASASSDAEGIGQTIVDFTSTLELSDRVASERFLGGVGE